MNFRFWSFTNAKLERVSWVILIFTHLSYSVRCPHKKTYSMFLMFFSLFQAHLSHKSSSKFCRKIYHIFRMTRMGPLKLFLLVSIVFWYDSYSPIGVSMRWSVLKEAACPPEAFRQGVPKNRLPAHRSRYAGGRRIILLNCDFQWCSRPAFWNEKLLHTGMPLTSMILTWCLSLAGSIPMIIFPCINWHFSINDCLCLFIIVPPCWFKV